MTLELNCVHTGASSQEGCVECPTKRNGLLRCLVARAAESVQMGETFEEQLAALKAAKEAGDITVLAGATAQPQPKAGEWPSWGRVQVYRVEA